MSSSRQDKQGRPQSPLSVARRAVECSAGSGVDIEAYVEFGRTVSVKVFAGAVESASVAEPQGIGVRAIGQGKTGYAFSTDVSPEGVASVVAEARRDLVAADVDEYSGLPVVDAHDYASIPGLWRSGISDLSLDLKTRLALEAEAVAMGTPGVVLVEESVYEDEETQIGVASTRGVLAESRQSHCWVYVVAHAGPDAERQTGLGFDVAREPSKLDPSAVGREAAARALALVGARPCGTGSYTLVLSTEVASALLSTVAQALSGDAVQKGRSVFAGRLRETVGSALLHLVDDGLHPKGIATCPFDGEGVPQQTTTLVDAGVLKSYLYDERTARKGGGGVRSTGNARRASYRGLPRVGSSNLVVSPGSGSLEDLLGRVGSGLYVESIAGLHSGVNPVSGQISLGISGRLIVGGALARPVREVTIATDFSALLGGVCDLGGEARWVPVYGSVLTPPIAVEGVTVSGS